MQPFSNRLKANNKMRGLYRLLSTNPWFVELQASLPPQLIQQGLKQINQSLIKSTNVTRRCDFNFTKYTMLVTDTFLHRDSVGKLI